MKKHFWIVVLTLFALGVQPAVAAKLYKWVDEYGNVTYRDTPPVDDSVQYQEKDISGGTATGGASAAAEEAADNFPVVMYSTPSCSPCNAARAYLESRGVPFQDKNVEGNGELQQELKKKAGEISVPTILVGPKVMKGYVQSLLEGELDAAGYPKEGEAAGNAQPETTGQTAQPEDQGEAPAEPDTTFDEQPAEQQ